MSNYMLQFTNETIPGKMAIVIPPYATDGPASPNNPTGLNGGQYPAQIASTSLLLVGKGVPNYGSVIQEDILHLLENHASTVPPAHPTIGQLWYNYNTTTPMDSVLSICTAVTLDGNGNSTTGSWDSLIRSAGGTMAGTLVLAADPINPLEAATKQYVDATAAGLILITDAKLPLAGGTMTGPLVLAADPTNPLEAATKQYVEMYSNNNTNIVFTPSGSITSTTVHTAIVELDANKLPMSGSTTQMTGHIILNANPTALFHAATKQYVDTAVGTKLSTSGDTMTGPLTLAGDPTLSLHAASKQYVDGLFGATLVSDGVVTAGNLSGTSLILNRSNTLGPMPDVTIAGIAPSNHTHTALGITYDVSISNDLLYTTYQSDGRYPTIPLNEVILTLDTGKANNVSPVLHGNVQISPGGVVTLDSNPTVALQATTKQYVDAKASITRAVVTANSVIATYDLSTIVPSISYPLGTNRLWVFVNGLKNVEGSGEDYTEDTSTQITFTPGNEPAIGAKIEFLVVGS